MAMKNYQTAINLLYRHFYGSTYDKNDFAVAYRSLPSVDISKSYKVKVK